MATRLFIQQLVQAHNTKTPSKLYITGSFQGESISDWYIPPQSANNVEIVSISWRHYEVLIYEALMWEIYTA